jgi:mRNA interferase MazF
MNRGDIWLINLEPTIGAEIRKTRPAVLVSSDTVGRLPLRIIVPIIGWKPHYAQVPWMIQLIPNTTNKLQKVSGADTFQVRSLSEQRFVKQIGRLDDDAMRQITTGLQRVLEIP